MPPDCWLTPHSGIRLCCISAAAMRLACIVRARMGRRERFMSAGRLFRWLGGLPSRTCVLRLA